MDRGAVAPGGAFRPEVVLQLGFAGVEPGLRGQVGGADEGGGGAGVEVVGSEGGFWGGGVLQGPFLVGMRTHRCGGVGLP